ncbi:MAG: formate dehydrogenase accessory sulfurtransferase FdhD [Actinomycetota bacterium]|nr:formate dehydrogenase accessory sulfurtransferase FdhD [Actinomycetota bacterium]
METLRRNTTSARVLSVRRGSSSERIDHLAGEEPMEIRAGVLGEPVERVAVTMRTPGSDFELAVGFLFTEGTIGSDDVLQVSYCDDLEAEQAYNVVTVRLRRPITAPSERNFYTTSSCGICGKAALDQVEVACTPVDTKLTVDGALITALPSRLRRSQKLFEKTGGLHAAGLFTADGAVVAVREDIGRHNAVDKVVGQMLLERRLPLSDRLLMVSGRASFEIVQKAAVAGLPFVCAVSAPSNLAVDAAERLGLTLIGFVRDDGFNVYSHPERVR